MSDLTDIPLPTRRASLSDGSHSDSSFHSDQDLERNTSRTSQRVRHSTSIIRARWSLAAASIAEADQWDLPCLARIRAGSGSRSVVYGRDTYEVTTTPLLLYAMHKCSRVLASVVRSDPDQNGENVDSGARLVLPAEYTGWFQFVQNDNIKVHSFKTIGEVAKAKPKEFVVHSPVTAYKYTKRSEDGTKMYTKVTVDSGTVLTTKNVLTEWLSDESVKQSRCFCFGIKPKPKAEASHMKCRDASGQQFMLPYQTTGGFSEVGQRGAEFRDNASYQLADIARWSQMPVTLKLVCGDTPKSLDDFSGIIRLEEVVYENSLVASTLGTRKGSDHQLIEFPVSSDLELVRNENWKELESTDAVESAILHCEEQFETFVKEIKQVNEVDPDVKYPIELTEHDAMIAQVRALPPTPLLPRVAKRQRSRAWLWARNLILKRNSGHQSDTTSEDSDYEVIPHYLRTVASTEDVKDQAKVEDIINSSKIVEERSLCEENTDTELLEKLSEIRSVKSENVSRIDSASKSPRIVVPSEDNKQTDSAHDEDGYLLPVEYRDSIRSKQTNQTLCTVNSDKTIGCSRSYHSSTMDTCSSATMTRDTEDTSCSLNKSTETLLAPPSSGTIRTYINSVAESEYSPTRFDQQRLDAFLTDSIHELHRRSRENLMVFRDKAPHADVPKENRNSVPSFENKTDVNHYLDKIFDCDTNSSEDKERESNSSGFAPDLPPMRSMSVPEAILSRPVDTLIFRPSLGEYGYQTLDSGIWLSPRSAFSDPYRHERDSMTYRSTSDCSWVPPESIEPLTVEEVGLSLRYIGMKDHIITRFCEEQIDGKQLAELDEKLLTEGFPDLNALDRKKLIDFIKGWRPKKWGYIPTE